MKKLLLTLFLLSSAVVFSQPIAEVTNPRYIRVAGIYNLADAIPGKMATVYHS